MSQSGLFREISFFHLRKRIAAFADGSRNRRAVERGQVERHQRARATPSNGIRQQNAGTNAADEFLQSRSRTLSGGFAWVRVREGAASDEKRMGRIYFGVPSIPSAAARLDGGHGHSPSDEGARPAVAGLVRGYRQAGTYSAHQGG